MNTFAHACGMPMVSKKCLVPVLNQTPNSQVAQKQQLTVPLEPITKKLMMIKQRGMQPNNLLLMPP
jgi:hypothetical protein